MNPTKIIWESETWCVEWQGPDRISVTGLADGALIDAIREAIGWDTDRGAPAATPARAEDWMQVAAEDDR